MSETAKPIGVLDWQLSVECLKCKEDFDAVDQDSESGDYEIAKKVFSNDWDAVAGCELTCPSCEHTFQLGGIEY